MNSGAIRLFCPGLIEDRISPVYAAIEKWVQAPQLVELIASFGHKIPRDLEFLQLLEWLLNFSDNWDYRRLQQEAAAKDIGEGARWLLDHSHLSATQLDLIDKASHVLGLVGVDAPVEKKYDYVLVLGGARLSNLLRPRLASELIASERLQTNSVVLLGSARPVSESERDATDTYAPTALTEFDLLNCGAEIAFQLNNKFSEERNEDVACANNSWIIRNYETEAIPVWSISAPSSEPEKRRANSADTYKFFFSKFNVPKGSSLLLVTSQIYVPYQQLEAIRTLALPHGVTVETIGFPPEWGGQLQGMAGPTNYLQETRSSIQAMKRFVDSFPLNP